MQSMLDQHGLKPSRERHLIEGEDAAPLLRADETDFARRDQLTSLDTPKSGLRTDGHHQVTIWLAMNLRKLPLPRIVYVYDCWR